MVGVLERSHRHTFSVISLSFLSPFSAVFIGISSADNCPLLLVFVQILIIAFLFQGKSKSDVTESLIINLHECFLIWFPKIFCTLLLIFIPMWCTCAWNYPHLTFLSCVQLSHIAVTKIPFKDVTNRPGKFSLERFFLFVSFPSSTNQMLYCISSES